MDLESRINELLALPPTPDTLLELAQAYLDTEHRAEALEAFQWRVDAGGDPEEVWYALYRIAGLTSSPEDYLAAYEACPTRHEPLTALARHYRLSGKPHVALIYATEATFYVIHSVPPPTAPRFAEPGWPALDEHALAAYWTSDPRSARHYWHELLTEPQYELPESERARIESNLRWAEEACNRT